MRKGAVDVQLNWVFILIAGTVILTFFFAVIQKQKSFSEQKVGESLKVGFDGIFTGALSSSDTVFTMDIPRGGVRFECDSACDCRFYLGDANNPFDDKMIFAKGNIPGPEITLWAVDFELPFHVTTYLYVTSPQIEYIFVTDGPSEAFEDVVDLWPSNLSRKTIPLGEVGAVAQNNNEHTAFVFFTQTPPNRLTLDPSFLNKDASGIHISKAPSGFYEAQFYTKFLRSQQLAPDVTKELVPSEAALLGVIFADDKDMYNCNLKETFKRLESISTIYAERSRSLEQGVATCSYQDAGALFTQLHDWAAQGSIQGSGLQDTTIEQVLTSLDAENDELLRQSCPLLY